MKLVRFLVRRPFWFCSIVCNADLAHLEDKDAGSDPAFVIPALGKVTSGAVCMFCIYILQDYRLARAERDAANRSVSGSRAIGGCELSAFSYFTWIQHKWFTVAGGDRLLK